jgi:hypothetical protein
MTWYSRNLNQTVTYWGSPVKDAWGDQTYPSPATLRAHWKEEANVVAGLTGALFTSHAIIHVESDIQADGFIYLGTTSATNPRLVRGAERIQRAEKFPTVRQDLTVYVAFV